MNDLNDAQDWRGMAQHLVQAHGADSHGLIGYTPTLEQLLFVHAGTHAALASINARPPDGHAHPLPMDAGWHEPRPSSYRPFPPAASAREDPFFTEPRSFPLPSQTGLPHTGDHPRSEADLAAWTSGRVNRLPEWAAGQVGRRTVAEITAGIHDWIKNESAEASARWLAQAEFSLPVQTRSPLQQAPDGLGQLPASRRRASRTTSAARQARPRSPR